jgi:hypothetical protein
MSPLPGGTIRGTNGAGEVRASGVSHSVDVDVVGVSGESRDKLLLQRSEQPPLLLASDVDDRVQLANAEVLLDVEQPPVD